MRGTRKCVPRRKSMESVSKASSARSSGVITRLDSLSRSNFNLSRSAFAVRTDMLFYLRDDGEEAIVLQCLHCPHLKTRGHFTTILDLIRVFTFDLGD